MRLQKALADHQKALDELEMHHKRESDLAAKQGEFRRRAEAAEKELQKVTPALTLVLTLALSPCLNPCPRPERSPSPPPYLPYRAKPRCA